MRADGLLVQSHPEASCVFRAWGATISDRYGMVAHLCYECHEGPNGVHHNRELDLELKEKYQAIFEETHSREEFRAAFGRSYL